MIILDTETTSLTAPEAAPIEQQPYITEFAAIKLEEKWPAKLKKGLLKDQVELVEVARVSFLCRPKVPIPADAVAITGITNEMVSDKPPFSAFIPALVDFFLGEKIMVAHNCPYDATVLRYELQRAGRVTSFPWPPVHICTVEKTINLKGHRLGLGALHLLLTGDEHKDAHRAMADVEALVRVVLELKKRNML